MRPAPCHKQATSSAGTGGMSAGALWHVSGNPQPHAVGGAR